MKQYILMLILAITVWGCAPSGAEFIDELDLVFTARTNDVEFNDFRTFVIPDTIVFISNDEDRELDNQREQEILDEINATFINSGWVQESDPDTNGSDVLILVSVLDNVNVALGGWWGYWGWWPGWGYYPPYPPGGWYPGYPWCCYTSVYSWRTGSLLIEMVDPNNPQEGQDGEVILPVLWKGGINGLLEGSREGVVRRTSEGIDQMFIDSPYLIKN